MTLTRRTPDTTVTHVPLSCRGCGGGLGDAVVIGCVTRQVLDVAVPRVEVTDHVVEKRRCGCGCVTSGEFPPEANGPVVWGPRARSVALYLHARQHLPYERCCEAMGVLFDAPISEGTLANIALNAHERLDGFLETLKKMLLGSPFVCADETSIRVGTESWWIHTVTNPQLTLLGLDRHRGIDAIVNMGVLPGYRGTIVHDGLATYHREELAGAVHGQCNAHLLRALGAVGGCRTQQQWTTVMIGVLNDVRIAATQAGTAGLAAVPRLTQCHLRLRYHQALDDAFAALPAGGPPRRVHWGRGWAPALREAWNLATRMRRDTDEILRVLDDTGLPFTNNGAERSLRMAKLHDKISGTFMNPEHAKAFCAIRSYIQTGIQQAQSVLQILYQLHTTGAWLPTVTKTAPG